MPDALDLLKTRRSIAAAFLAAPGPSPDELRDILTIGARVPDHGKLVPWRYVTIEGEASKAVGVAFADILRRKNPDDPKADELLQRYATVPLTVVVISKTAEHPKIPEWEQFLASGAVAMNLILAVHAMGYAAQWVTGVGSANPDAARLLGAREGEKITAIIHIGTPTTPPSERARPDIDAITSAWSPPETA